MHENHRDRVKKRFLTEGLSHFEQHNILEFLLFYSIPQQDTNEIAHALLERFGSLEAVFDASAEELMTVSGIKEHSATLIRMIPAYAARYCAEKNDAKEPFPDICKIGEYLLNYYRNIEKETAVLLLLDNKFHLIEAVSVYEGPFHSPYIGTKEILETALRKRASVVVLAHNHPDGIPLPTRGDILKTQEIENAFRMVDIRLISHLLIAGGSYTDILRPQMPLMTEENQSSEQKTPF